MTTDLACLVLNALWGLVLVFIEITGKTRAAGAAWNRGNRQDTPRFPAWIDRTGRALVNHKENFPLFLTAVLVVHLVHANDRTSAIASMVYVVARVLHGVLYIFGIEGLRTLAFVVGLGASLTVLSRLVF
ncbi:MAG: hypothetical protein K0S65_1002 [Labilithrix sp.]|nr:hypothetical protein [Labilithrix sp.]